ncbi:MAG: TetR/AcrR family transcriptional regulator [Rhodospirillaceae bacterium]|nr:TetR/AcrR family transcriptional regulator [Rhodospirillaceae bacterium]
MMRTTRKTKGKGHNVGAGADAGRDTRERIVGAAQVLFWEKGYAATGMAEILKRADANAGSFYHFFKGKEDVLLAVLDFYLDNLDAQVMDHAFKATTDPVKRVFNVLAGYRSVILATDFAYGCPLGRLAFELDPEDRHAHAKIAANFAQWRDRISDCVKTLGARLKPGIRPDDVAALTLAVMEGGVIQARSEKSIKPFDAAVKELRRYFDSIARP